MTGARAKHTPRERAIAKQLGLSDAQLDALLRIRAGYWPGNAAAKLLDKGLAYRDRDTGKQGLTEAGEAILKMARSYGF